MMNRIFAIKSPNKLSPIQAYTHRGMPHKNIATFRVHVGFQSRIHLTCTSSWQTFISFASTVLSFARSLSFIFSLCSFASRRYTIDSLSHSFVSFSVSWLLPVVRRSRSVTGEMQRFNLHRSHARQTTVKCLVYDTIPFARRSMSHALFRVIIAAFGASPTQNRQDGIKTPPYFTRSYCAIVTRSAMQAARWNDKHKVKFTFLKISLDGRRTPTRWDRQLILPPDFYASSIAIHSNSWETLLPSISNRVY